MSIRKSALDTRRSAHQVPPASEPRVVFWSAVRLFRLEIFRLIRDWRVLVGLLPLMALIPLLGIGNPSLNALTSQGHVAEWAMLSVSLTGAGFCVAFVDIAAQHGARFGRSDEIAAATLFPVPLRSGLRAAAALALSTPILIGLIVIGVSDIFTDAGFGGLLAAALVYLTVVLPGLLVALGLSAALGAFLRPTLARILSLAVWAWSILLSPAVVPIPSPSGTLFTPVGDYAAAAFFGAQPLFAGTARWLSPEPSSFYAVVAVTVLLAVATALFAITVLPTRCHID